MIKEIIEQWEIKICELIFDDKKYLIEELKSGLYQGTLLFIIY